MFNDYDLKTYAARQQQAVSQKYDLAMRNALEEEKLRGKNAKERQDSVNKTTLEQEKMQQTGQTERQNSTIQADSGLKKSQAGYYDAQTKGVEAETVTKNMSNDFQKATQPGLINEQNARSETNTTQARRFGTYYSAQQAEDERKAILSGYGVDKNGIVSNSPSYFDPVYGRGNLQNDLKAIQDNDSAISNNKKIKPQLAPPGPLSRMSNGNLPNQNS